MASSQVVARVSPRTKPAPNNGKMHSIGIAGLIVVHAPEGIRTVLGSCIGIALYEKAANVGGMGHVILPDSTKGSGEPGKFADTAVDQLMDMMVEQGAKRTSIVAKIAGGATMFGVNQGSVLGERNAAAVKDRLRRHGVRVVAEAIGGVKGRKMALDASTGMVQVEMIGATPEII